MYRSGLVNTLVTHANMKGFGLTPLFGDCRGYMPPQLKTNKQDIAFLQNYKQFFFFWFFDYLWLKLILRKFSKYLLNHVKKAIWSHITNIRWSGNNQQHLSTLITYKAPYSYSISILLFHLLLPEYSGKYFISYLLTQSLSRNLTWFRSSRNVKLLTHWRYM